MKNKYTYTGFIFISLLLCVIISSSFDKQGIEKSNGAPPYNTGAPLEKNCGGAEPGNSCHSNNGAQNPVNTGPGTPEIIFSGANNQYEPGKTYSFVLKMTQAGIKKFGFQAVILKNSDNKNVGTITITEPQRTKDRGATYGSAQDRRWVNQLIDGSVAATTGYIEWTFDWTAPAGNVGNITIYASFIAANNNGLNDPNDQTYTDKLTIVPFIPKIDAGITKIIKPDTSLECLKSITPQVTLKNYGDVTLTTATIKYKVDNNAALSKSWTGSLAPGATETVTLPSVSTTSGNHTFYAWTDKPNGSTDVNPGNDQSSKGFAFTIADAGPDKTLCSGGKVQLGGNPAASSCGNPFSYSWSPSTGLSCTNCENPDASPSATTTYTLTVTNADNETATDKVTVTVSNMTVNAGNDVKICAGSSTVIGGSPSASGCGSPYKYSWSPAAGLSCTNCTNPKASPSSTTTYTLTVTDINNNSSTDQVVVTVDSQSDIGFWKFDEANGTTAADASGNNRNGILVNNPQRVQGISGNGLQFNGNSGHVAIADFNPPQNLTIEAWIYPTGGNGVDRIIVDKSNDEYDFRINSNGNLAAGVSKNFINDPSFNFDNVANQNKWYHLVYVFDNINNIHSLFRNGVKVATGVNNSDITNTNFPMWIGRHSQFNFGTFAGIIDEVHLYACPLGDDEIKNLYEQKVCSYKADYSSTTKDLVATFTDNSTGALSWFWDFGDGNSSNDQNPVHTFTTKGTYKVCLTITASCGTKQVCKSVMVNEPCKATANFTYTSSGLTVNLSDNSQNVTSWNWDMGDGNNYSVQSPTHTYSAQGTYDVCLMVSGSCGTDTVCRSISVKSIGVEDVNGDETFLIYPNPASGVLFIKTNDEKIPYIEIYNLQGQRVIGDRQYTLNKISETLLHIDLEEISTGIYYVHLRNEEYQHVKKLIIR